VRFEKTHKQLQKRGFPYTVRPDERNLLATLDRKRNTFQHFVPRPVRKRHIFQGKNIYPIAYHNLLPTIISKQAA
jgi:hypothetical protein